jgi:preprotein translocase subunit SecE
VKRRSLLRTGALVLGMVVGTIVVFFAIGYVLGRVLL